MKVLNLYAGIGGNRKLWGDDIQVTAVELDPDIAAIYAHFYPDDNLIVGDAHQYLIERYKEFDFIWASPPCPTHSRTATSLKGWDIVRYPDMKLYQEIILLKHFFEGKFVVENVVSYYTPLIEPIRMCRHFFWSNFRIGHADITDPTAGMVGDGSSALIYQKILGVNIKPFACKNKRQVLRNMVNPELGKHIFDCAAGTMIKEEQLGLFA